MRPLLLMALTVGTEISLGDLLTALSVLATAVTAIIMIRSRLDAMLEWLTRVEKRVEGVEAKVERVEEKQDNRIRGLEGVAATQARTLDRVIARLEVEDRWRQQDRRQYPRTPSGGPGG